jgi:type II secretory pathway component PulF
MPETTEPSSSEPLSPSSSEIVPTPGKLAAIPVAANQSIPGFRKWASSAFMWVIAASFFLGGLTLSVSLLDDGNGIPLLIGVPATVLLIGGTTLLRAVRRSRAEAAVAYLEQATRLNLPLAAMLSAAEQAETGGLRRGLRQLRMRLAEGQSVNSALALEFPALPRRSQSAITAAEQTGQLADALRRLAEQTRTARLPAIAANASMVKWYPLIVTPIFLLVMAAYVYYIVPKYERILADFHLPPPAVMAWVAAAGETLFAIMAPLCAVILVMQFSQMGGELMSPRIARHNPIPWLTDRLAWWTPALGTLTRSRATADAYHAIADALDAGRTLDDAVAAVSFGRPNAVMAARAQVWAGQMRNGVPPAEAARAARLAALDVGLLATARGPGDLQRVLRFLAGYHEARFSRAASLLYAAVVPAMALFFGALAATLALAIFLPLQELINHLSGRPLPGPM